MEEKELLTILSEKEYKKVLQILKRKFGKPSKVKRLGLQCTDYRWDDIDNRIRITNGNAELIQKVGSWKGKIRKEIAVPLPSDAKIISDLYTIFKNALKDKKVLVPVIQVENLLFEDKDLEIKLTHQFGKKDAYSCEVEVFNQKLDPLAIAEELNIPIHLPEHTPNFWKKWNETVNLSARELTDKKLTKLIASYLK